MKRVQKLLASMLALVFSLTLVSGWPDAAGAEDNVSVANRYNVVLVMDKSGSLRDANGVGTDPDGLRFDAMRLFLGLLTESGNNVGVIAFDDTIRYDSGLRAVNSLSDKKALVQAVEALGTSYDTDIGAAVLRATEILSGMKEKNGLPCAILLLTDGMTDFYAESGTWIRMDRSKAAARAALDKAKSEGITIHGILLNVDGRARNGEEEIRLYTDGTRGQIETVSRPEDLAAAFARFYSIINKTEYNGAHKSEFSAQGEVQTSFPVPAFGMEEVNIVVERGDAHGEIEQIRVTDPDGRAYNIDDRILDTSRFLLVKIPQPMPGDWHVTLKGSAGDSVDICMIYNASLNVSLNSDTGGEGAEVLKPIRFRAVVTDNDAKIGEDKQDSIAVELAVRNLSTGEAVRYPMDEDAEGYSYTLTFKDGGDYEITAMVGLSDFEVRSDPLVLKIDVPLPVAKQSHVSDITEVGSISDNVWSLSLDSLFEDPKGTGLRYTLSDDCGGAITIENAILRANLEELGGEAAFTVIATDAYGLTAELPFDLAVALPSAKLSGVKDIAEMGSVNDNVWEVELSTLFEGTGLRYALSDDCGGAVKLEDGKLRVKLDELGGKAAFTVTATDSLGLTTELPFGIEVALPAAKVNNVKDIAEAGSVNDNVWEVDLAALFEGDGLNYALSDDCGGAVKLEDGKLRVKLDELGGKAAFTVTATDSLGLTTELPFDLAVDLPSAKVNNVKNIAETGSVNDNIWEVELAALFEGDGLNYALSDDCGGAVKLEDGKLRVKLDELDGKAAFTVTATDSLGLTTELPFDLAVDLPSAKVNNVKDIAEAGSVNDNVWEVELSTLFDGSGLNYALSDDCGGAVKLEDGKLRVKLDELEGQAAFTVTATDSLGLMTELPFDLEVALPSAKLNNVKDIAETGSVNDNVWEVELAALFEGSGLNYTLSDDCGGAVKLADGKLRVKLDELDGKAAFTVTATDSLGLTTELPFGIKVALPSAKQSNVKDIAETGSVHDNIWEVDLAALFEGSGLNYTLSDDCGGAVKLEDGKLCVKLDELKGQAAFTVTARDSLGLTTALPFDLNLPAPEAKRERITDLSEGHVRDNVWELDLGELFDDPLNAGLHYTLLDGTDDAVTIQDGILRADLEKLPENASFSIIAQNAYGQSAELPVELAVAFPEAKLEQISDALENGRFGEGAWELNLSDFFENAPEAGLRYTLSDDLDGSVTIENDILRVRPNGDESVSFVVTATDKTGLSTELPVEVDFPAPAAKMDEVSDVLGNGRFGEDYWELELNGLFEEPKGTGLRYTLSDNCGGAVTIDNDVLRVRPEGVDAFSFTVTATDGFGFRAELPFHLSFPAPAAKVDGVSDTVKTGLFQKGTWKKELQGLFEDPKGGKLEYTLSDEYAGKLKIEDETLHADCKGIGEADFTVKATDSLGLSAEIPFKLAEKDMTWTILGIALLAILSAAAPFLYRRRNSGNRK